MYGFGLDRNPLTRRQSIPDTHRPSERTARPMPRRERRQRTKACTRPGKRYRCALRRQARGTRIAVCPAILPDMKSRCRTRAERITAEARSWGRTDPARQRRSAYPQQAGRRACNGSYDSYGVRSGWSATTGLVMIGMPLKVLVAGSLKSVAEQRVLVGGALKQVSEVKVLVGGVLKNLTV